MLCVVLQKINPLHFLDFYAPCPGTSQCGTVEMPLAYTSSITVFVGREAIVLLRGFDVNEFGVMRHLNPGQEITYKGFR